MSGTHKDRKDKEKGNGKDSNKGSKKATPDTKTKLEKTKGPVPTSYASKKSAYDNSEKKFFCGDVGQLLNGCLDKDKYLVGDVELAKDMFPIYKGASVDELVIVAENVPSFHPLALAGCGSGTRIPYSKVMNSRFVCNIKNDDVFKAINALWKFLRNAANLPIENDVQVVVARKNHYDEVEQMPAEPQEIEREPQLVAQMLWNGQHGVVETHGVTFEIKVVKVGDGSTTGIFIKEASYDSGLMDAELDNYAVRSYLTVGQLRNDAFQSKLTGNSAMVQQKMWTFIRGAVTEAGLIVSKKPEVVTPEVKKVTTVAKPMQPKVVPVAANFNTRPLAAMLGAVPGYYNLNHDLVVKMYKVMGIKCVEVAEIGGEHPLHSKHGVAKGYSIPASLVAEGVEKDSDPQVTAFVEYIRSVLIEKGVVKFFKNAKGVVAEPSPVRLVTKNGEVVAKTSTTSVHKPIPLAKGFMERPAGPWVTIDGVVIHCEKMPPMWKDVLVRVVSAPSGHELDGYKRRINLAHLKESESGFPGKELREYLRMHLCILGELPRVEQEALATA